MENSMASVKRLLLVLAVMLFVGVAPSPAGPYTDELSKCLVASTTAADRVDLVKWMFAAASSHPAVRPMSTVTPAQLDAANRKMGALVMRLLTETCVQQTRDALKYEGAATLQTSFQVLGQVAGRELFTSPEVKEALSGLDQYVDGEKVQALAQP
jgi:hypothetical protein